MKWDNDLTKALGITYPVVQAPMLGVTTPAMVAAISNEGGLGSLPVGGLSPEKTIALIRQTKQLTAKPFGVNLFVHDIPPVDTDAANVMQELLKQICRANHISFEPQDISKLHFYSYKDQTDVLLNEQIPIISFTFGIPDDETIQAFHEKSITLIGTATCLEEAVLLDKKEIDMITSQGIEAGGHRGSFLYDELLPQVGTFVLTAEIVQHINKPVLAAGGIYNGNTIKAALQLGAAGVQTGTAFIGCNESAAIPSYKAALTNASDTDTALTKAFSGRWARGIRNMLMTEVERAGIKIPAYPVQNTLTSLLRATAQQNNNKEFTNLWAGQMACKAEIAPAAHIFRKLIAEAEER